MLNYCIRWPHDPLPPFHVVIPCLLAMDTAAPMKIWIFYKCKDTFTWTPKNHLIVSNLINYVILETNISTVRAMKLTIVSSITMIRYHNCPVKIYQVKPCSLLSVKTHSCGTIPGKGQAWSWGANTSTSWYVYDCDCRDSFR